MIGVNKLVSLLPGAPDVLPPPWGLVTTPIAKAGGNRGENLEEIKLF